MNIGKYNVEIVEAGTFGLDGGAMFGVVPKVLWSRNYDDGDEKNRIKLAARLLLVRWDDRLMLVDTGNGTKLNEKLRKIYNVNNEEADMEKVLKPHGVKKEDITDVLLTHLHFDHAGGATTIENGIVVPTFPNAKYYVQKDHLKWAQIPTDKDRASFMPDNYEPLLSGGVLELLDGEGEFLPGIYLDVVHGHTRALQTVRIGEGADTLFYCSDLSPTSKHVPVPYVMGYDNEPLKGMEEKAKFFSRAYEENWTVLFEHDAFSKAHKITATEKGFLAGEKVEV